MVKLKNKSISFRLLEADYLRYKKLAAKDGLTLTKWIIKCIERGWN
jgi:predicted DNA binding CopG/RHH family protein